MAKKIPDTKARTGKGERRRIPDRKKRTKVIPKKKIRMIEDFIIPHLRNKTFGKLLEWENEELKIFKLSWKHQSSSDWREEDFRVFLEWRKMKGFCDENDPNKFAIAKDRFRNALNKFVKNSLLSQVNYFLEKDKIYYQLQDLNRKEQSNEVEMQTSVHENNNNDINNQTDNTSPPNLSENVNEDEVEQQSQLNLLSTQNENIPGESTISCTSHDVNGIHQHGFEDGDDEITAYLIDLIKVWDKLKKVCKERYINYYAKTKDPFRNPFVKTIVYDDLQLNILENPEKKFICYQLKNLIEYETNANGDISDMKNPSNYYKNRNLNPKENCNFQVNIEYKEYNQHSLIQNNENLNQLPSSSYFSDYENNLDCLLDYNENGNCIENPNSQNYQINVINQVPNSSGLNNVLNNDVNLNSFGIGDLSTENDINLPLNVNLEEYLPDFADLTDPLMEDIINDFL